LKRNEPFGMRFLLASLIVALAFCAGCGTPQTPPPTPPPTPVPGAVRTGSPYGDTILKLGRIPFTNATEMVKKHEALLKHLTQELGVKETRLVLASDYQGIFDKLVKGEIDIAWLASLSSVDARGNPKVQMLVKPKRFGTTSYRGIIITRSDSGIRKVTDLKGKRFAWVEKESASGYIFPKAMLKQAGVDPEKDFAEVNFLNKHDAVVLNVLLGKFDAGACYDDARNTLREKEKINELTILATTQDISNEPIVCRNDLPEDLITKIRQAFLRLDTSTSEGRTVLKDLTDVEGFVPASDDDYQYIAEMLRVLEAKN
jgi:phosphonate transport system substrate-binding protein